MFLVGIDVRGSMNTPQVCLQVPVAAGDPIWEEHWSWHPVRPRATIEHLPANMKRLWQQYAFEVASGLWMLPLDEARYVSRVDVRAATLVKSDTLPEVWVAARALGAGTPLSWAPKEWVCPGLTAVA